MRVATLNHLLPGSRGEVLAVTDDHHGRRLRRVGVREGAIVEILRHGNPSLLRLEGGCVAVGSEMLPSVTICRCGCDKEDETSQRAALNHAGLPSATDA